MKKLLSLLLMSGVFLLLAFPAYAQGTEIASGTCGAQGDNLTWVLDDEGTMRISGTGDMDDYEREYDEWGDFWYDQPWHPWEASILRVEIGEGVTSIGEFAFDGCSLTEITIPNSVTSIRRHAFNESELTKITIPESMTSIGEYALGGCYSLMEITIPDSVTSIEKGAFASCSGLTEITIPNSVTSIGESAFSRCTSLTEIVIPDGVISIGVYAFDGCSNLTEITIPNSVTNIGRGAFFCCRNLKKITIPKGITNIEAFEFCECNSLTEITIPDSVTSIGACAFSGCTSLKDVYYDGTEKQWTAISIVDDSSDSSECLASATLHCANNSSSGTGSTGGSTSGGSSGSGGGGGGCYVATAVYGSYDCPEVWTLRRYRDYELSQTAAGRAFIRTYYAVSPTIVEYFGDEEWFQDMWRGPLDKMVSGLQAKGYESTPYEDIAW